MGGSQSKSNDEEVNMHDLGVESDKDKTKTVDVAVDDDEINDPLQRLFFLLRKSVVDVPEVTKILNAENKINLNQPDVQPELPTDMDPNDPLYIRMKERISKKTYLGDYALHLLVGRPSSQNTPELIELVKLFFLCDHPMNCRNSLGSTPLHRACAAGNAEMAKELITWGAEADAVNNMHHTCLHMACYAGHTEVVKLLLDSGCAKHLQYKSSYGIAPVDYVLKDEVYQLLKAAHRSTKSGRTAAAPVATATVTPVVPKQEPVVEATPDVAIDVKNDEPEVEATPAPVAEEGLPQEEAPVVDEEAPAAAAPEATEEN